MFQTFISRHNSNFFSDKLVLTSVTPASSAPVLQTPKATSSTLYFDSLTVNRSEERRVGKECICSWGQVQLNQRQACEARCGIAVAGGTVAHGMRGRWLI